MAYSGLTPTDVLRYLNRMLGSIVQHPEIKEEEMMRVVFQESLKTYSKFFPYNYRIMLNREHKLPDAQNVYMLPNDDNIEILNIKKVYVATMTNQMYSSGLIGPAYTNPIANQLFADFISRSETRPTWEFRAPNLLELRPLINSGQGALIEVNAMHPKHLKTIDLQMRDEFLKLCFYDVLLSLYPIKHRFESMDTSYGSINVFLEQVDRAEDMKEALIQSWRENKLRSGTAIRLYIG